MSMINCPDCGNQYSDKADSCPKCGCPNPYAKKKTAFWSSGRLIIGILSMVLPIGITFQSCFAGLGNALANNHATSGTQGVLLSAFMFIGGLIASVTRNSGSRIVTILPALFYWFGALMTLESGATYGDLPIWGGFSFVFGLVYIVAGIKTKKNK